MNTTILRPALIASAALLTLGLSACTPSTGQTGGQTGGDVFGQTQQSQTHTGSTPGATPDSTPGSTPDSAPDGTGGTGGSRWDTLPPSAQGADAQSDGDTSAQSFSSGDSADFDDYLVDVINDVNGYWANQFDDWSQTVGTPSWGTVNYVILDSGETAPSACTKDDGSTYMAGDPEEFTGTDWAFWCPPDSTIYISSEHMWNRVYNVSSISGDAVSDFAVATVIAHEFGHAVQTFLGFKNVPSLTSSPTELQADCLAGIWSNAKYSQSQLSYGDVEEGVNMLVNLGEDLKTRAHHGTSEERSNAFMVGYNSGDASQCTQTLPGAY